MLHVLNNFWGVIKMENCINNNGNKIQRKGTR